MATYYSNEYQDAYVDVPSNKIAAGNISGTVLHANFTVDLAGAVALNEVIKLVKIPKGARLLQLRFVNTDLGSAGDLDIGWSASEETSGGVAVELGDQDGIVAALDVNAAAGANNYYPNRKFAAEVDLQCTAVEATTAAGTLSGYILYTVI